MAGLIMKVRKLRLSDAPLMLEWMHDDSVVHDLKKDFAGKTEEDCISFIVEALDETESIHLAITDDRDEYLGTVSLKHIFRNTAEFGIVLRACAIGRGYASFGMEKVIEYGCKSRGIDMIYWCVSPENKRALRFYDKNGFQRCNAPEQASGYTDEEKRKYIWYRTKRQAKA